MGKKNKRNVMVPEPGEDILGGIRTLADGLGVITPAASVEVAREIVRTTTGVTPANPMYFDIQGNIWKHDGTVFQPAMQVDYATDYYTLGWNSSLRSGEYSGMITTSLPARPYARCFIATGQAWGNAPSGNVDLALKIGASDSAADMALARWSTGADRESTTVTITGIIPAGQKPAIHLGVRGGSPSGGRLVLSADPRLQRLTVMAFPIPTA